MTDTLTRPDPSTLTTDALHREIGALTELMDAHLNRLAASLIVEKEHAEAVLLLKDEIAAERFRSIDTQFQLRDTAADKLAVADQKALAAALQAQKEAASATYENLLSTIAKSEGQFTKLIDGIAQLISSSNENISGQISDLKGRLDRGDGRGVGQSETRTDSRLNTGASLATIMAVFAFLSLIIAAFAIFRIAP